MNDTIIIQQVYSNSDYLDMVKMTIQRHLDYCNKHKMDLHLEYGNVIPEYPIEYGGWAKVELIKARLNPSLLYKHVIWLDADAVIVDMSADLRDACPKSEGVGMTRNPLPFPHFNVGMMYITNGETVRRFVREWLTWYPGPINGWHEQAMLNIMQLIPTYQGILCEIDFKYNSCKDAGTQVDKPVVQAFHGAGSGYERYTKMREFLSSSL